MPIRTEEIQKPEPEEIHKTLRTIINECSPPIEEAIRIISLTRGYKVEVGCTSFAFEKLEDMIEAINLFLDNPIDAQNMYSSYMYKFVDTGISSGGERVRNNSVLHPPAETLNNLYP